MQSFMQSVEKQFPTIYINDGRTWAFISLAPLCLASCPSVNGQGLAIARLENVTQYFFLFSSVVQQ